jgi:hypothetical protein
MKLEQRIKYLNHNQKFECSLLFNLNTEYAIGYGVTVEKAIESAVFDAKKRKEAEEASGKLVEI